MKTELDPESRKALIKYRLERAIETLKEADYNAAGGYFNNAVNRLYYSAFYAMSALLIHKGFTTPTHQGAKSLFSLYFINSGLIDKQHAGTLNELFINRQVGDY